MKDSLSNIAFSAVSMPAYASTPLIGARAAEEYNAARSISDHSCFCYAPFTNMLFAHDGSVHVCCHNFGFSLGKYPQQSIREIWNSAKADELRESMRRYDLTRGCAVCEMDLKSGSYGEVKARHFDTVPRHPQYPAMMEFLISNTCNLECVMCSGEFSSLIRKNREKLPPLVTPYDQEFLRQLEEFVPFLHETRFSGSGEAFSIDMLYEIWEMIIRQNPKCIIMVQSNGTILTERVKDILSRGNFQIGISLDSLNKETYESIRVNAKFEKVMDHIRYFEEYSRNNNRRFSLAMCVMRQNWEELPAFINFCNSMNATATLHKVWYPLHYALHNLSAEKLHNMHEWLSAFDFPEQTQLQAANKAHYRYFLSIIKNWAVAQDKVADTGETNSTLSLPGMVDSLKRKLSNGITESSLPEKDKILMRTLIPEKLDAMLGMYNEEQEKEEALRKMCGFPDDLLFALFKDNTADFLFSQAKKYFSKKTA